MASIFSSKISVCCSQCHGTLQIPRPTGVTLVGPEWHSMPCPSCGLNLAPEARLVLAETGQKEGIRVLLAALVVVGAYLYLR
jgi:hypothetical protein